MCDVTLVARGKDVPLPLAKFAIMARPDSKTGPDPEHARAIRLELFARMMEEEGFERHEVNPSLPTCPRHRRPVELV